MDIFLTDFRYFLTNFFDFGQIFEIFGQIWQNFRPIWTDFGHFSIRFISRICINKPGAQKAENYLQISLEPQNTVIRVLQTLLQIFFDPSNFLFAFTPMGVRKQVLDPQIHKQRTLFISNI